VSQPAPESGARPRTAFTLRAMQLPVTYAWVAAIVRARVVRATKVYDVLSFAGASGGVFTVYARHLQPHRPEVVRAFEQAVYRRIYGDDGDARRNAARRQCCT